MSRHVSDIVFDAASRAAQKAEKPIDPLPALSLYEFLTSILNLLNRVISLTKMKIGIADFFAWKRPAKTFCLLLIFTKLIFNPQWLLLVPLFCLVANVLVPNYAVKFHIKTPEPVESELEIPKESVLILIRKGQQKLSHLVHVIDQIEKFFNDVINFSDPQFGCLLLFSLAVVLCLLSYLSLFLNLKLLLTCCLWATTLLRHPEIEAWRAKLDLKLASEIDFYKLYLKLKRFSKRHVLLDEVIKRKVEVYEIEPKGLTDRQWLKEFKKFSTDIYLPNSPSRLNHLKIMGVDDLADVEPPTGFEFEGEWEVGGEYIYDSEFRRRRLVRTITNMRTK